MVPAAIAVVAALAGIGPAPAQAAGRTTCRAPQWRAYVLPDGRLRDPLLGRRPRSAKITCWPPRRYVATVTDEWVETRTELAQTDVEGTRFEASTRFEDRVRLVYHLAFRLQRTGHLRNGVAHYAPRGGTVDYEIAGSEQHYSDFERPIVRWDCSWRASGSVPLTEGAMGLDAIERSYDLRAQGRQVTVGQSCTSENAGREFGPRVYEIEQAPEGKLSRKWLYSRMSGRWTRTPTDGFTRTVTWEVASR